MSKVQADCEVKVDQRRVFEIDRVGSMEHERRGEGRSGVESERSTCGCLDGGSTMSVVNRSSKNQTMIPSCARTADLQTFMLSSGSE